MSYKKKKRAYTTNTKRNEHIILTRGDKDAQTYSTNVFLKLDPSISQEGEGVLVEFLLP
jgi:hypothetical protein